jgi:hypothetical protein
MAEEMARDTWARNVRHFEAVGWSTVELVGGDEYAEAGLAVFTAAEAEALADLSRPSSRDAWVRWGVEQDISRAVGAVPQSLSTAAFMVGARAAAEAHWHALRDNPDALGRALMEMT